MSPDSPRDRDIKVIRMPLPVSSMIMMEEVDIQEAFGDKIPFHPNNLVRKQRKSSRSPINPVDLDRYKSGLSSKHELGPHDTCVSHNGTTPNTNRKYSDKRSSESQKRRPIMSSRQDPKYKRSLSVSPNPPERRRSIARGKMIF